MPGNHFARWERQLSIGYTGLVTGSGCTLSAMASFSKSSDDSGKQASESADDSAWMGPGETERDPERKVLYSHLKDMAIDALELSKVKDQGAISQSIGSVLSSFDMQPETADVLASMVVAAFTCAQESQDERAIFLAYSCFTDSQLARIIKLARSS